MIKGTGIDIVDLRRFQSMDLNRSERLAKRILTEKELTEYCAQIDSRKFIFLAKHWSVKESVAKAHGTGISGIVVWKNMELSKSLLGRPQITFLNFLEKMTKDLICHVSISHDGDYLISSALLEYAR
jgi:holo-[acyl-carrier protein] synthase